ncbi:hypothetical protein GF406_10305 [candidate division KSB1 bacterium]|nr:hypothetical protein [candidate division KSB1 bacterium]
MSRSQIEQMLKGDVQKHSSALQMFVWIYVTILVATVVMNGINIAAYQSNGSMVAIQALLALISVGFIAYGLSLVRDIKKTDRMDQSLLTALQERMKVIRYKYERWYLIMGFSIVALTFAVTTMKESDNGHYTIHQPVIFILFTLFQFTAVYALNKVAHYPFVKQLKAYIHDLEHQVTEQTARVVELQTSWKKWGFVLVIFGLVLFIYVFIKFLQG